MEIQEELERYLSLRENNGALLLNGGWGSGKTYLAKTFRNQLREKDACTAAIVSLFGVSDTAELHQKVKVSVLNLITDTQEQTERSKLFRRMKELLDSVLTAGQYNPKMGWMAKSVMTLNVNDLVNVQSQIYCFRKGILKEQKLVLIFDDVERCKIGMDLLLGAINEYTEVRGIKTILLVDESHIEDENYWVIKEKLVGQTLNLYPDYRSVVSSMVNTFVETSEGYRKFLVEQTSLVRLLFRESGSENLRTLKKTLVSFERVYDIWSKQGTAMDSLPGVFYTFGAIQFEAEWGNFGREADGSFRFSSLETKRKYSLYQKENLVYSLAGWVVDGVWDGQTVRTEISLRFDLDEEKPERKLLYCGFSELTDELIEQGIPAALEKAYSGRMDSSEMVRLLERFAILRTYELKTVQELDDEKLMLGLKKREELLKNGETAEKKIPYYISKQWLPKLTTREKDFYRQIQRLPQRSMAWEIRRNAIGFALGENQELMRLKYQSFICFDDELLDILEKAYQNGDNEKKERLISYFKDFRFFDDEISTPEEQEKSRQNLTKLYHWIEADSDKSLTAQILRQTTLNKLEKMINQNEKGEGNEEPAD